MADIQGLQYVAKPYNTDVVVTADPKKLIDGSEIMKKLNDYANKHPLTITTEGDKTTTTGVPANIAEVYRLLCLQGFQFKDILDEKGDVLPEFADFLAKVGSSKSVSLDDYVKIFDEATASKYIAKKPADLLDNKTAMKNLYGSDDTFDGIADLQQFEDTIGLEVGYSKAASFLPTKIDKDGDGTQDSGLDQFLYMRDFYYKNQYFKVRNDAAAIIQSAETYGAGESKPTDMTVVDATKDKDTSTQLAAGYAYMKDASELLSKDEQAAYFRMYYLMNHNKPIAPTSYVPSQDKKEDAQTKSPEEVAFPEIDKLPKKIYERPSGNYSYWSGNLTVGGQNIDFVVIPLGPNHSVAKNTGKSHMVVFKYKDKYHYIAVTKEELKTKKIKLQDIENAAEADQKKAAEHFPQIIVNK